MTHFRFRLTLSLTEGRRRDKRHRQRSTAGSWSCWLEYVIRISMNTWSINSIITNRASDRYSEHCIVSIKAPQGLMRLTRLRADPRGTPTTQINLNKHKLGEPSVYLKPVVQTLYSATVPIMKKRRKLLTSVQNQFYKKRLTFQMHIYIYMSK